MTLMMLARYSVEDYEYYVRFGDIPVFRSKQEAEDYLQKEAMEGWNRLGDPIHVVTDVDIHGDGEKIYYGGVICQKFQS